MILANGNIWERIRDAKKQLIETRRDVIVHTFYHHEERLIKVLRREVILQTINSFRRWPKNNVAIVL